MRNQQGELKLYRKYIAQMSQAYAQREDVRIFIELLLTLTAIFVFVLFAIRPTLRTIGGLTQEISGKKETIATMDTKITNIQAAQAVYNENVSLLPFLLQAVPDSADVVGFVKQIELISTAQGTSIVQETIQSVPIKGEEVTEGEHILNYTITFNGSLPSLISVNKQIQEMRRGSIFSTTLLSISDTTEGGLNLTISGQIPYLVQNNQQIVL